jgi:predicted nucleic acid-binding Zn ribbon protein
MNRDQNEENLGEVIERLLKAYGLEEGYYAAAVSTYWEKLMGPAVAKRTGKISIEKGVLKVEVDSPALREELSYAKEKIKTNINKEIGQRLIREVEVY